jgi:hypothetical protein
VCPRPEHHRTTGYQAAKRAVAARHHPDRGGDPETFIAAMAALEHRYGAEPPATPNIHVVGRSGPGLWLHTLVRTLTRRRRTRYIDL